MVNVRFQSHCSLLALRYVGELREIRDFLRRRTSLEELKGLNLLGVPRWGSTWFADLFRIAACCCWALLLTAGSNAPLRYSSPSAKRANTFFIFATNLVLSISQPAFSS